MKKQYTKKQIQEAISYWKKQLHKLDEGLTIISHDKINFVELLAKAQEMKQAYIAAHKQVNSNYTREGWDNAKALRKEYNAFIEKYQKDNIWFVEDPQEHMPITVLVGYGKLLAPAPDYEPYPFDVWDSIR